MKNTSGKNNSSSGDSIEKEHETDFSSLNLSEIILKWLSHKNFKRMTRVQSLCLRAFLKRENDVLVQSCTGSDVFSVIILPTRELSIQVFDIIIDFLQFTHLNMSNSINNTAETDKLNMYRIMEKNVYSILMIGGTSVDIEIRDMKKAIENTFVKSFVVGTPGRLRHVMDLLSHEFVWTFRNLRFLILDEADRLLEMGFQNDLSNILTYLPKQRQTGLFSATLNTGVETLSKLCLHNHIHINTDTPSDTNHINKTYTIPKGLNNYYLILSIEEKLCFLLLFLEYLRTTDSTKIVIFFLSCDLVNYYHQILSTLMTCESNLKSKIHNTKSTNTKNTNSNTNTNSTTSENSTGNIRIMKIHRKMTSKKRNKSIETFKSNTSDCMNVLLCTDVFSRGIDVPGIDWILQIGRAGRAETPGNALLLLTETEESYIQFQKNHSEYWIKLHDLKDKLIENDTKIHIIDNKVDLMDDNGVDTVDTRVDKSYLSYLMENPVNKPILLWEKTAIILSYLRLLNSKDRELLLLSSRAFVSYTRAYSEHSLKYIFEKQKLDYGALATSLGVLRIPRVKEILGRKILHFIQSNINPKDVPYLDPVKEANRLKQIEQLNTHENGTHDKITHKDKNDKKIKNKVIKDKKINRTRTMKREAKRRIEFDEWNEFRREEALVKKLKKKGFNHKDIENLNQEECEFGEDLELDEKSSKRWILRGKKRNKRKKH
ncbi:ATP-dependent RNA helicase, putative [Theileria annulata]|uniref:ATP-dependent RNA helicase n=1 Tax=Theileria annulata TaxID=5874 RepID=Q4UED4_THEAN|nr:ATP-dependent RNA helicase, putative [Theileria annulata]CAI74555.1 ATP-dependent RNA helicase, putative [Theileria annulata]|eukprot:XP_952287.1 ATP-dependent RNA helicase, putative [Theileria annulata]